MRYWDAKADANQPEIVKEFRRLGAFVFHVHRLKNCCDLIVLYKGVVVAVEVKMPGKKLTAGEDVFSGDWTTNGGKWAMVTSIEEARGLIESIEEHL
jgi:hypothetical protein